MVTGDMPHRWYEDYERGRPGYPDQVVDLAELASPAMVLELAAGTGKLTRQLASKMAHLVVVEPDPGMRRLLVPACPGVEAIDGTAERIPLANDAVDAVFVAQAFHWFDNEAALAEIARVLRPGGALVVMWNVANGPVVPSVTAVEELLAPIWPQDSGFPLDMMSGAWTPGAWNLPFAEKTFNQIREALLANRQTVDPQALVAFFGSMGWIANLPDEERQPLVDAMRSHLTAAEYVLPWQTRVQWTRLSAPR
ncbi:class I SAM-dependent methyltransferase [Nocardioides speluncae]|uniref:class I SAM-dependent methyltransferase n=1 Tax=Nocardioides speluncae TaxID=2670337 RepID=UPI000D69112C|nr:class I SAM-dependent methyltransferase [Nocardioides speluncae]